MKWFLIERLAERNRPVRGIRLSRSYRQHTALLCGIRAAQFEVIVKLDNDAKSPPEEIGKLIAMLGVRTLTLCTERRRSSNRASSHQRFEITRLALESAMGGEAAGNVSAFRPFRTHT